MIKETDKATLFMAVGLAAILGFQGMEVHDVVQGQIERQERELAQLDRWMNQYESLVPVNEEFLATFPEAGDEEDLLDLYEMMEFDDLGLNVNPDTFRLIDVSAVEHDGVEIGLAELCFSTDGHGSGLQVSSQTVLSLLAGVETIQDDPTMAVEAVRIQSSDNGSQAVIEGFCARILDREAAPQGGG